MNFTNIFFIISAQDFILLRSSNKHISCHGIKFGKEDCFVIDWEPTWDLATEGRNKLYFPDNRNILSLFLVLLLFLKVI